jgi:hypothetical protein
MFYVHKDFHGAVTYEFGGVFAWQMYGTTQAEDSIGPYTVRYYIYAYSILYKDEYILKL